VVEPYFFQGWTLGQRQCSSSPPGGRGCVWFDACRSRDNGMPACRAAASPSPIVCVCVCGGVGGGGGGGWVCCYFPLRGGSAVPQGGGGGGLPHGSARAPLARMHSISKPHAPRSLHHALPAAAACIWPVQCGARLTLSLCKHRHSRGPPIRHCRRVVGGRAHTNNKHDEVGLPALARG
jgi:hypothetical protein